MFLAGDIGGTKTVLAAFDRSKSNLIAQHEQVFVSNQYAKLEDIVSTFISTNELAVEAACFGFAGPVRDGQATGTNLPWNANAKDLGVCLKTKDVWIINDLEANAYGIGILPESDFCVINAGESYKEGNAGLISAGTGLGEAGLAFDGKRLRPFATEGGHTDLGPKSELEIELLRYLQKIYGSVSWERIVSGMGFLNIYNFLRETGHGADTCDLTEEILHGDSGAIISRTALAGKSELCEKTLTMFVSLYGAEAGNLALKLMATAGMYIGGGIAPKILNRMKLPLFFDSFCAKGRMEKILRKIPVQVILNDKTALLGAAEYAYVNLTVENPPKRSAIGAAVQKNG
jgi:glucokinase